MITELRQYSLRPGARDELIALFDREFVESQEACGMAILGQFRDLDAPDRFVWLRGFASMPDRLAALTRFYYGPVWKAHAAAANATMIDTDDVLLLRPSAAHTGVPVRALSRPPIGASETPASVYVATIDYFDGPLEDARPDSRDGTGIHLQTEYAENTFPALPVRTGEHVRVRLRRFETITQADARMATERSSPDRHAGQVLKTERLRLAPTARSLLR